MRRNKKLVYVAAGVVVGVVIVYCRSALIFSNCFCLSLFAGGCITAERTAEDIVRSFKRRGIVATSSVTISPTSPTTTSSLSKNSKKIKK